MFKEIDNKLTAKFVFEDFMAAFGFMTQIAFFAERMNHHPHWSNTYNEVQIDLTTHSANNTITGKDYLLAKKIEELYSNYE